MSGLIPTTCSCGTRLRLICGRCDSSKPTELDEALEKIERLEQEIRADRAFCVCGCPESDHESYGEDGEACEDQHHECIRVCAAAASIAERLRAQIKAKDEALRLAEDDIENVLYHVEDAELPRVNGQCTLCHTYRSSLRETVAAIRAARGEK